MNRDSARDLTALLLAVRGGDAAARDALVPLVVGELRRMAAGLLRRERRDHTLQPTALVNEVYLRLFGREAASVPWQDRVHFFGAAARSMRQVLVDHARAHRAAKRGGLQARATLTDVAGVGAGGQVDVIDVDRALDRLAHLDARQAEVVELRVFIGLEVEEVAEVLGVSPTTVKREWRSARAWLRVALGDTPSSPEGGDAR
jgi:RNA polymerase sigma factor (TIGR02999 family)